MLVTLQQNVWLNIPEEKGFILVYGFSDHLSLGFLVSGPMDVGA